MAKGMMMQNGRLEYQVIKKYALDLKLKREEIPNTFPYAHGLIEEIRKTYQKNNGNGLDKLNGVFEQKLEFLYNYGIDQPKKLSLLIILESILDSDSIAEREDSIVRRKVACALLFGLANKIVNSEEAEPKEKLQLANDIFRFFIDYINDTKDTQKSTENLINNPIVCFILNHQDMLRSLILTLNMLYPGYLENPVTKEECESALSIPLLKPSA